MYLIGIDIGGTKCAVSLGKRAADGGVRLLHTMVSACRYQSTFTSGI